ncbi:MAG: hypothetical protein AAGI07_17455 [Bacteroidota bacterium]
MEEFISSYLLPASYVLVALAAAGSIILPLIKSISDPKSLVGTAIGLGILIVIFLIGYSMAGDEVTPKYMEFDVGASLSKFIGGVLTMFYILLGVSLIGIVYTEVSRIFK